MQENTDCDTVTEGSQYTPTGSTIDGSTNDDNTIEFVTPSRSLFQLFAPPSPPAVPLPLFPSAPTISEVTIAVMAICKLMG